MEMFLVQESRTTAQTLHSIFAFFSGSQNCFRCFYFSLKKNIATFFVRKWNISETETERFIFVTVFVKYLTLVLCWLASRYYDQYIFSNKNLKVRMQKFHVKVSIA